MIFSTLVSAAVAATASPLALPAAIAGGSACCEEDSAACTLPEPVVDDLRPRDDLQRAAERVRVQLEDLRERRFENTVLVDFADREQLSHAVREGWERARPAARVAHEEKVAKMLGMLPARASLREEELRLLEQTVSFFDAADDRLYLLDSGGDVSELALAAGLSEAFNEQQLGAAASPAELAESTDRRWVRQAVLRGSNVALLLLWALENLERLPLRELGALRGTQGSLADSPPYVWKPLLGLALRGESFLRRSTASGWISPPRLADLDQAVVEAPLSTEQILHPDKYWTTQRRDDPTLVAFDGSGLPGDWSIAYEDTLGEMVLSVLTEPFDERRGVDPSAFALVGLELTHESSSGWDGDRIALLEGDPGTIAHLVVHWDRPADATEFADAAQAQRAGILANLAHLDEELHGLRVTRESDLIVAVTAWTGVVAGEVDCVLADLRLVVDGA